MVDKWVVDGKVAVVYSPGYGAGWSTWSDAPYAPSMVFDAGLAKLVHEGDKHKIREYAKAKWPDAYQGGLDDVVIMWVPEGTLFSVTEYAGYETIKLHQFDKVYIA